MPRFGHTKTLEKSSNITSAAKQRLRNPNSSEANPLKDVQNILGFLLAGFAGVLSFLGLQSAEVSTVLRNYSPQASFIALILFLAALTAVYGVAVPGDRKISWPWAAIVFVALLGIGWLTIRLIPISAKPTKGPGTVSYPLSYTPTFGWLGNWIRIGLLILGIAVVIYALSLTAKNWRARMQLICIVASVTLLAISVYGAMRLEAFSQRVSSVQISASIAKSSSKTTLSAHVAGYRLETVGYVGVIVSGLPRSFQVVQYCKQKYSGTYAECVQNPCSYIRPFRCHVVFSAAVPPDANGNLNYTLSDGLVPAKYQDISVQAVVCQVQKGCNASGSPVSKLDIHLSKAPVP